MPPATEALTAEDVSRSALDEANKLLGECAAKIGHCVNQLSDEQIWWRPAASLNSIGNLILHLCGNLEQWIVSGIGGAADTRRRPDEFAERGPMPKSVLVDKLTGVVAAAQQTLARSSSGRAGARADDSGFYGHRLGRDFPLRSALQRPHAGDRQLHTDANGRRVQVLLAAANARARRRLRDHQPGASVSAFFALGVR